MPTWVAPKHREHRPQDGCSWFPEALQGALHDLGTDEVKVNLAAAGVGAINESDVNLAMTSEAVLLGFNVRADSKAKKLCEQEGIDLRYYSVIYELIDDVKQAERLAGTGETRRDWYAQVRDVFRSSSSVPWPVVW